MDDSHKIKFNQHDAAMMYAALLYLKKNNKESFMSALFELDYNEDDFNKLVEGIRSWLNKINKIENNDCNKELN